MKRIVSAMMLTLLLTSMLTLAYNIQPVKAEGGTIYIRADGSIDPPTAPIQRYGDVYTLTDNVYDSLVIVRNNIVVEGTGKTVQGTDDFDSRGIDLSNRVNVTVTNTRITAFYYSVYLYHSSNNRICGNNITDNSDGVWMDDSSSNSISVNDLDGNRNVGIVLYYSSNNSASGNNIANNAEGIWVQGSFNNSISGNNIANNVDGIGLDNSFSNSISRNNITDNNNWSMMLVSSSTNSVSGNTFTDDGLYVWDSYMNSVENNTVNGKPLVYLEGVADYSVSEAGQVILVNCDSIRVENLNLSRTIIGVQLLETNNTLVSGNNITDNNNYGIWVQGSFNNSISGNNITDNWTGIYLYTSSSNNIVGNNITDNWTGIWLGSSSNNSVSGNNITGNHHYGILTSADGNLIYHNNFIDNSQQVSVYTSGYPNVWDDGYPSGGNYWSNYTGVDLKSGFYQNEADSDGIGDMPYIIDANNVDKYPLMGMFTEFNATLEQHVQTICNSTISDFHFNGTAMSFNVSGENDTAGFCRICIPTALMNVTYKVFVNGTGVSHNLLPCSNETYSYLYFNYTHSTEQVVIIPEFPSFLILPLFMIATLLAVIVYKRKHALTVKRAR